MLTVICNLKGGVGKSTLTFNLAVWLLASGRSSLLFDLDPQKTLTDAVNVRTEEGYEPVLRVMDSVEMLRMAMRQKDTLEILVDTGGTAQDVAMDVIAIADRVIVPVQPSQADIWSTQRFMKQVRDKTNGHGPEMVAFVNRADTHHAVRETDETEQALDMLSGLTHLKHRLCQRTAYRRSFSEGLAVFEMGLSKAGFEMIHFAEALYKDSGLVATSKSA